MSAKHFACIERFGLKMPCKTSYGSEYTMASCRNPPTSGFILRHRNAPYGCKSQVRKVCKKIIGYKPVRKASVEMGKTAAAVL